MSIAEQTRPSKPGPISAEWGAVGLLLNPERPAGSDIKGWWSRRVEAERQNYAGFAHAVDEQPAISADGFLSIPWPFTESGAPLNVDALLATATVPSLNDRSYATPQAIAEAWKRVPKEQEYFDENRRMGITTADDDSIIKYLGKPTA